MTGASLIASGRVPKITVTFFVGFVFNIILPFFFMFDQSSRQIDSTCTLPSILLANATQNPSSGFEIISMSMGEPLS